VKEQIYVRVGLHDSHGTYKKANGNYKKNFGRTCLGEIVDFVTGINGFNWATRWAWRILLNAEI
jgi:hypothetical protein